MFLHTNRLEFQQRKSLSAGLESIKSWFDIFFTITPSAYFGFPFSIFSQLMRCVRSILTLYQLTTLGDPSWDENDVLKTVNPPLILDRVITNLEQVATLAGLDNNDNPERDVFSRAAQMLRSLQPGWKEKQSLDDLSTIFIPQNANGAFPPDALAVEFFDNDWLMDLLSPNY
jgi:hypothetical protein